MSDKQILSTVNSNNLSSIKKVNIIPRNTTRQARDIHTPAILRKVENGKTARFTFSTYRLPSKVKCKYKLKCIIARCGKVFTTVRSLSQHHILKHRSVKYWCRICLKWSSTQIQLHNHMYTHMEKSFVVADVIRDSHFRVISIYIGTYTGILDRMSALLRTAPGDINGHKISYAI